MPILTTAEYDAVRKALDTVLDSSMLPDTTIALAPFLTAADLEVKRRDPGWASRTGDDASRLQLAAIYLTAAYLAPAVPALTKVDFGNFAYAREPIDWAQRAADLWAMADDILAGLTATIELTTGGPRIDTLIAGTTWPVR